MEPGEAVSPELVLVDPELAARARAALPDHPWPAPVPIEAEPQRAAGRLPAAFWTFAFSFALIVLVSGLSLVSTDDRPTFAAEVERNQTALTGTTDATATQRTAPARPKRVERTRSVRARPKTRPRRAAAPEAQPKRRARRQAPPRQARPTPSPARPRFRPARVFSWPPHAGAAYYQVVFLRNGRPFYRTRARTARLRVPARVRFTAGSYRWSVRPAIAAASGIRLARPIVDSTFQVDGG